MEEDLEASMALLDLVASEDLVAFMAVPGLALLALALLDLEASMAVLAGSTTTTVLEVLADLAVALAVALVVDSTVVTTDLVVFTATVSTDRALNQLSDLFRSSF